MKHKFISCLAVLFVLVLIFLIQVRAIEQNVSFNGNFTNGTILYSNVYNLTNVNITAKDAYPIRNCSVISTNKTIKSCSRQNRTIICVNKTIYRNITKCSSLKAYCENPYASNTNQLSLTNFAYSPDNGASWFTVPYTKFELNNVMLIFRVNIPALCYPNYNINSNIKIKY